MATPPPADPTGPVTSARPASGSVKKVSSNPATSGRPAPSSRGGSRPAGTRPPGTRPSGSPRTGTSRSTSARTDSRPRSTAPRGDRRPPIHEYTIEERPLGDSGWKAFFRPVTSNRAGTMPAGMVLVVVLAALLISMFASADAISRKASGRRNNSPYRITVAEGIAKFSDTFRLSAPANAVACGAAPYLERTCATNDQETTDELLEAQAQTDPAADPAAGQGSATPTTIDRTPKVRVPTPQNPLKVWVGGDSTSYEPGIAMTNLSSSTKLYNVTVDARASTGLVRDDYFNWPAHLVKNVTPQRPDVVFIMFGGNDAQGIVTNGGAGGVLYGTPEWQAIYRKRVGDTMDLLRSSANDRFVVWMGMPPVSDTSGVDNVSMLNYIYATEAVKRPWVRFLDSWPYFANPDGSYALSLPAADGTEQVLRSKDGVHFSFDGGNRMGWVVYQKFASLVDLSAAPPLPPDPTEAPPPDIKERTEIPPGENQVLVTP